MSPLLSIWGGALSAGARAAAVGTGAVLAGVAVQGVLASRRKRERTAAWVILLVPYLTPALVVGYGWSGVSLSLVRCPALNEALYDLLLLMRFTPVAALAIRFAPRSMTPEAMHCHRLTLAGLPAGLRKVVASFSFWLRGPGRAAAAAFALVFLFAFGEFELASLLDRPSWTKSLFDAQVGGTFLSESLRLALVPLVCELAVFLLAMAVVLGPRRGGRRLWFGRQRRAHHRQSSREARVSPRGGDNVVDPRSPDEATSFTAPRLPAQTAASTNSRRPASWGRVLVWVYLAAAAICVGGVPALVVLRGTYAGLGVLVETFVLGKDILAGLLFALGATVLAYSAGEGVLRRGGPRAIVVCLICLPGLLGALLLSLAVLAAFQLPYLRAVRGGPLPLLVTLALLLLPYAWFLAALCLTLRPRKSLHLADLMKRSSRAETRRRAGGVVWELATRKRFWAGFLLFWWGYFDLTASSMLAPAGMTPVSVRLYNLMHYGRSAVLSAMVSGAVFAPVAMLIVVLAARRAAAGWRLHRAG